MLQLFLDRCREAEGNRQALVGLWAAAVWDVVKNGIGERLGDLRVGASDAVRGMTMGGWMQDLRFAGRSLRRRPGFALAAVATLALGIGATVSIFSVVNGVLLKPLPYPQPESVVVFWNVDQERGSRTRAMSHPDIEDWRGLTSAFDNAAGYTSTRMTLTGFGQPEAVQGGHTTGDLLAVFGLTPLMGRDLIREDDIVGGPRVVVVGHGFWTSRLGRNPDVLGRTIALDGTAWEIVGVAPEGFDVPGGAQYWVPFHNDPDDCGRGCRIMAGIGRLSGETTLEGAQLQVSAVSRRMSEEYPKSHTDQVMELERLADSTVADVKAGLWVLFGAVAMVLLIACANVANLLLVRATDRSAEVALRATLGASGVRLARQLLTESLLLAFLAGAGGSALAWWGTSLLMKLAPGTLPRTADISMDGSVLLFAGCIVLTVTVAFGLLPALQLARRSPAASLNASRGSRGGRGTGVLRSLLLSGEVALSLMLLLGAGLLFRTLGEMRDVELGFAVEQVERFRISLPDARYEDGDAVARFMERLEGQLRTLPEVAGVGIVFGAPLASGSMSTDIEFLDREEVPPQDRPSVGVRPASPGYLDAAGIPLMRGRWFRADDTRSEEPVVVLSQTAAARFYGDDDPIGKQIRLSISWGYDDEPSRTIVGVVGDVRTQDITEEDRPAAYIPNAQFGAGEGVVTMRLRDGAETALTAARSVVSELDPELALTRTETMAQVVQSEFAAPRFYATLLTIFSSLALILAGVGLYGVIAFGVSRRTREIGIRMALGARSNEVTGMVIRQGFVPAVVGVAAGLVGAWLGSQTLATLLYGVQPYDPVTLVAATALLLVVVFAATLLPARRASRVAPSSALRAD
jgi:putative ABC transport system permease protein